MNWQGNFTHCNHWRIQGDRGYSYILAQLLKQKKERLMTNHVMNFRVSVWKQLVHLYPLAILINLTCLTWITTKSLEGRGVYEYLLNWLLVRYLQRNRASSVCLCVHACTRMCLCLSISACKMVYYKKLVYVMMEALKFRPKTADVIQFQSKSWSKCRRRPIFSSKTMRQWKRKHSFLFSLTF